MNKLVGINHLMYGKEGKACLKGDPGRLQLICISPSTIVTNELGRSVL